MYPGTKFICSVNIIFYHVKQYKHRNKWCLLWKLTVWRWSDILKRSAVVLNTLNAMYQICTILKVNGYCKYASHCKLTLCCIFKHPFLYGPLLTPLVGPLTGCKWRFLVRYITITLWVKCQFHSILSLVFVFGIEPMSFGMRCVTTCNSCFKWLPA